MATDRLAGKGYGWPFCRDVKWLLRRLHEVPPAGLCATAKTQSPSPLHTASHRLVAGLFTVVSAFAEVVESPADGHHIAVDKPGDIVAATGCDVSQKLAIEVVRNGVIIGAMTADARDVEGSPGFEADHEPDLCWSGSSRTSCPAT